MNKEVKTIKDFTEALQDTNCSKITLTSNIQVLSVIDIDRDVCVDLNEFTIRIHIAGGLVVSNGEVEFINGDIISQVSDGFVISGKATNVKLASDVSVQSEGCAILVKERAKLLINGSDVASTRSGSAIKIEGFTIAKDNTSVEVINYGSLHSKEGSTVDVSKRGSFKLTSGIIECGSEEPAVIATGKGTAISFGDDAVIQCVRKSYELDEDVIFSAGGYKVEEFQELQEVTQEEPTIEEMVRSSEDFKEIEVEDELEIAESIEDVVEESEPEIQEDIQPVETTKKDVVEEHNTSSIPQPVSKLEPVVQPPKNLVLKKPVYVYGTPSNKIVIGKIAGCVGVILDDVRGSNGSNDYMLVSYVMSGIGGKGTGYIRKIDIM